MLLVFRSCLILILISFKRIKYDNKSDTSNVKAKLKESIERVNIQISTIYDQENLKKIKYNLHSVCIHEGDATSGHYWTYIWNALKHKWYKFNDVKVCESTWEALYADAVGGRSTPSTPSAYCLIYTKAEDTNFYRENNFLNKPLTGKIYF